VWGIHWESAVSATYRLVVCPLKGCASLLVAQEEHVSPLLAVSERDCYTKWTGSQRLLQQNAGFF